MPALMQAIQFKQPKPIPHYSAQFQEFVFMMLNKKKEDRPIITDLIEYFGEKKVPCFKMAVLSQLDQQNYQEYKGKGKVFEKKRTQEKNLQTYNKDFEKLKARIQASNQNFKNANFQK